MYPLKFKPIFKSVVWGGDKIAPYKGVETDLKNIGESWELSGVKGMESVVENGQFAGKTITELASEYKGRLLGEKVYAENGTEFPLLVKFIDARDDLSIQVHPDDDLAGERHNGSKGKTEMWYIIQADEDAHLMSGFSQDMTPAEYLKRVEDNTITDVLCDYKVKAGDLFFLPAGRVHSIGKGCFIAEIQQTSDITYRIYDFGRLGLDGEPRELHTEQAVDAIDYSYVADGRTDYTPSYNKVTPLVSCEYFKTDMCKMDSPVKLDINIYDSFLVVVCLKGEGQLNYESGSISLCQGETLLIPACLDSVTVSPVSKMKILTCRM